MTSGPMPSPPMTPIRVAHDLLAGLVGHGNRSLERENRPPEWTVRSAHPSGRALAMMMTTAAVAVSKHCRTSVVPAHAAQSSTSTGGRPSPRVGRRTGIATMCAMPETHHLSQAAYDRLAAEHEDLTTRGRIEIARKIEAARELGDLSENGDYHAAKDEQGQMEGRIRHLAAMLDDAEIVEVRRRPTRCRPARS